MQAQQQAPFHHWPPSMTIKDRKLLFAPLLFGILQRYHLLVCFHSSLGVGHIPPAEGGSEVLLSQAVWIPHAASAELRASGHASRLAIPRHDDATAEAGAGEGGWSRRLVAWYVYERLQGLVLLRAEMKPHHIGSVVEPDPRQKRQNPEPTLAVGHSLRHWWRSSTLEAERSELERTQSFSHLPWISGLHPLGLHRLRRKLFKTVNFFFF